jgi:hypothetical protein
VVGLADVTALTGCVLRLGRYYDRNAMWRINIDTGILAMGRL